MLASPAVAYDGAYFIDMSLEDGEEVVVYDEDELIELAVEFDKDKIISDFDATNYSVELEVESVDSGETLSLNQVEFDDTATGKDAIVEERTLKSLQEEFTSTNGEFVLRAELEDVDAPEIIHTSSNDFTVALELPEVYQLYKKELEETGVLRPYDGFETRTEVGSNVENIFLTVYANEDKTEVVELANGDLAEDLEAFHYPEDNRYGVGWSISDESGVPNHFEYRYVHENGEEITKDLDVSHIEFKPLNDIVTAYTTSELSDWFGESEDYVIENHNLVLDEATNDNVVKASTKDFEIERNPEIRVDVSATDVDLYLGLNQLDEEGNVVVTDEFKLEDGETTLEGREFSDIAEDRVEVVIEAENGQANVNELEINGVLPASNAVGGAITGSFFEEIPVIGTGLSNFLDSVFASISEVFTFL